ncbi:MAG TPA: efflux RND transporter periplasmic adaptor subunit [Haliangiales bacterium]|nr:efflux RND transporter periplasmic adaptor subunit [Haliangiales bacterium]
MVPLLLLGLAACNQPASAGKGGPPPPAAVKLQTLVAGSIQDASEYIGTLKSRRSITVQPQVEGQLTKIFVKSGDTVDAGTPLMQIDASRQQAAVASAQATRAARLASLAYAKQQLERIQRLYDEAAVSKQELDQAKANRDSAQADVDALGAQIRQNEVQLDYYRIVAPAHGVVGDIPVRVGDRVTTATVLTTVDDNGALEAYVSIPIERAGQLRRDMEVEVLDSTGVPLGTGHVYFISPQVNADTQSILIKTDVQNEGAKLRAEQFVRARVVWSTHEGVSVPALAVVRLNGQTFVYVAESHDGALVAKQRAVALGELTANAYVVLSGLKAGEKVVVSGLQKLGDGAPIAAEK